MPNNSDFCFRTSLEKKTSGPDNFGASPFRRKTFRRQTFVSYCQEQSCRPKNVDQTSCRFNDMATHLSTKCVNILSVGNPDQANCRPSLSGKRHMLLCRPNTCLPNDRVADVSTKLVDLTCRPKVCRTKDTVTVSTKCLSAKWQGSWCANQTCRFNKSVKLQGSCVCQIPVGQITV